MKKLLTYAATDSLKSFLPVLCWMLLPLFTKNSSWAQGLIVTYPFQFIGLMSCDLLCLSQMKYEETEHITNRQYSITGILLYLLLWITIFTCSCLGWNHIRKIFGLAEDMKELFLLSCASLGLSFTWDAVCSLWQYEGKNKKAFMAVILWWITEMSLLFLFFHIKLPFIYAMPVMCLIMVAALIPRFKHYRFRFKPSAMKYDITDAARQTGMFIIYCGGMNRMGTANPEFLAAYNIMSLCSDTQWDIVNSACDKHAVKTVSAGKWNEKQIIKQGFAFGCILFTSTMLLLLILYLMPIYRNSINFKTVLTLALIESSWLIIDGIANLMEHWISFVHPNPAQPIFTSAELAARTVLTYIIPGLYSTSIAMAYAEIIYVIHTTATYIYFRQKDRHKNRSKTKTAELRI